jgi:hypothetical protein
MRSSPFLAAIAAGLAFVGAGCGDGGGCPIEECYRAVRCVEECGGPVVQSGCCPCPEGSFDDLECQPGSGG